MLLMMGRISFGLIGICLSEKFKFSRLGQSGTNVKFINLLQTLFKIIYVVVAFAHVSQQFFGVHGLPWTKRNLLMPLNLFPTAMARTYFASLYTEKIHHKLIYILADNNLSDLLEIENIWFGI